jgi:hypothetical protein
MQRTTEKELLQASGKTRTCQTQVDTKPLSATCLSCPAADLLSTKQLCLHPGKHNTLFVREPHILAQLGSWLHSLWTKLVAKYTEGIFLLCLEGGGGEELRVEKALVGMGQLSSPVEKARLCTALEKPGAS